MRARRAARRGTAARLGTAALRSTAARLGTAARVGTAARLGMALLLGSVVLAAAGCSSGAGSPDVPLASPGAVASAPGSPDAGPAELTIFAAASLADAVAEAAAAYEGADPGTTLTVATGASSALATQVEEGAPADVFLSADAANVQRLVDGRLADGSAVAFAANELTVIVPAGNPAGISTPADLARPGVRIVAAGDAVPVTKYARQVVANLAALPGYPADYAAAYEANVVSREDNVRAAAAKVELGEADAAIVYVTDAAGDPGVAAVAVPAAANVRATYTGVVVRGTAHPMAARAFLAWLAGPAGREVLAGFGFLPPP